MVLSQKHKDLFNYTSIYETQIDQMARFYFSPQNRFIYLDSVDQQSKKRKILILTQRQELIGSKYGQYFSISIWLGASFHQMKRQKNNFIKRSEVIVLGSISTFQLSQNKEHIGVLFDKFIVDQADNSQMPKYFSVIKISDLNLNQGILLPQDKMFIAKYRTKGIKLTNNGNILLFTEKPKKNFFQICDVQDTILSCFNGPQIPINKFRQIYLSLDEKTYFESQLTVDGLLRVKLNFISHDYIKQGSKKYQKNYAIHLQRTLPLNNNSSWQQILLSDHQAKQKFSTSTLLNNLLEPDEFSEQRLCEEVNQNLVSYFEDKKHYFFSVCCKIQNIRIFYLFGKNKEQKQSNFLCKKFKTQLIFLLQFILELVHKKKFNPNHRADFVNIDTQKSDDKLIFTLLDQFGFEERIILDQGYLSQTLDLEELDGYIDFQTNFLRVGLLILVGFAFVFISKLLRNNSV